MSGENDTIVATSSGGGRAALAVIRVSGRKTRFVLETMAGGVPPPRRMTLRDLVHDGETLDRGLVVWFPGPASFSGEDMAEVHIHGGLAVATAVLRALCGIGGVRLAEAGEFTRRAVLNGKLDLAEAEALGDLIEAETEAQRRQAVRQLGGALGQTVGGWREELLTALALIEADLDFGDEGDVGEGLVEGAVRCLEGTLAGIEGTLNELGGERLRSGFTAVVAGPPNSGKSSLINYLAKRDVAIVSPYAGTTRDVIEVHCDIGGYPVLLVDTAGLRNSEDPIEREGVSRAEMRMADADAVVWLEPIDSGVEQMVPPTGPEIIRVRSKADLFRGRRSHMGLWISVVTGEGTDRLLEELGSRASEALGCGTALITRERHRAALREAAAALRAASEPKPTALLAEDVRRALHAVGSITGHVGAEDVLDRLFATFCIGK